VVAEQSPPVARAIISYLRIALSLIERRPVWREEVLALIHLVLRQRSLADSVQMVHGQPP